MADIVIKTERDGSRSFEHDDRWSGGGRSRGGGYRGNRRGNSRGNSRGGYRGSYSNSYSRRGSGGSYRSRGRGGPSQYNPRTRLDDDGDEVMGNGDEAPSSSRYNPYGRSSRGGGYRGKNRRYIDHDAVGDSRQGGDGISKMARFGLPVNKRDGDPEWWKVTIPFGKKTEKEFILTNIMRSIDVPFIPTGFHHEEQNAVFHVQDKSVAMALKGLTKKITMPTGYKMTLLVRPSNAPNMPMSDDVIEKLKVVMSNRYDPATKSLNLSSLHTDTGLKEASFYLPLARRHVMTNVVKIITENIPELCALDFSNNKLFNVDDLAPLVSVTVDMKALNFSKNKVTNIECFKKISGWKLEVLSLEDNPLRDKYNDQSSYVSAVRNIFPKVLKLDNLDLPPPITFDIESNTDLPKAKENSFPNPEVQTMVVKFLNDYFTVYDSENRNGLAGAYHNDAMFSLSVAYNGAVPYKQSSLAAYIDDSRNLVRNTKDGGRRQKMKLKYGSQIVSQLCLLPKTLHDKNTFNVDCSLATASMMNFTVQGVFKEVDSKSDNPPVRAFSRTFNTVPGGSGMLIINDMLTITNPSQEQKMAAFKHPAPTPSSSPVPQTSPTNNPFQGAGLTDVQQRMVVSFINQSGMNSEWSAKCLAENSWDYEKAGQNFLQLQKQGMIPPEAFNK